VLCLWWPWEHACACVCVFCPCLRKLALFVLCLVKMVGFEETATNKTRDSNNDRNMGLWQVWYYSTGACTAYPFLCARGLPQTSRQLYARTLHLFARLFAECVCCACAGPLWVCALHLIARAVPVPARVLCLAFGRHYGEFSCPIDICSSVG